MKKKKIKVNKKLILNSINLKITKKMYLILKGCILATNHILIEFNETVDINDITKSNIDFVINNLNSVDDKKINEINLLENELLNKIINFIWNIYYIDFYILLTQAKDNCEKVFEQQLEYVQKLRWFLQKYYKENLNTVLQIMNLYRKEIYEVFK